MGVQMCSTILQVLTIQTNAWFMVTAMQNNKELLELWVYLWKYSTFGLLPESTWQNVFTPKTAAIFFWCLSTVQLTWPLMTSLKWPGSGTSGRSPFPTRSAEDAYVTESCDIVIKETGQGGQEDRAFVPETFFYDFSTPWSKVLWVLEVWGFTPNKCTYRESVANLALASGLRYTGSMSLSYPRQRIEEIIGFKEGYSVKTSRGLEPLPQGWEMRSLKEFQKLARCHMIRVFFIMFCKLALPMNLQITFIIIYRIQQNQLTVTGLSYITNIYVSAFISIMSLLFTFTVELLDVVGVWGIWRRVRRAVKGTIDKIGSSSKAYAFDDFTVDGEDASEQRIIHSGKDLKTEYYFVCRQIWRLTALVILSALLVIYALL